MRAVRSCHVRRWLHRGLSGRISTLDKQLPSLVSEGTQLWINYMPAISVKPHCRVGARTWKRDLFEILEHDGAGRPPSPSTLGEEIGPIVFPVLVPLCYRYSMFQKPTHSCYEMMIS